MRAYTAGLVACSLLLLCGAASAADYGDNLGEPNTLFGGGTTRYDAASGLLTINATPLSTRLTPGARRVAIVSGLLKSQDIAEYARACKKLLSESDL